MQIKNYVDNTFVELDNGKTKQRVFRKYLSNNNYFWEQCDKAVFDAEPNKTMVRFFGLNTSTKMELVT
tara:strand:- start:308 stop:511 length:204 start_codon:yes stop_codon:yes gene_type:complete